MVIPDGYHQRLHNFDLLDLENIDKSLPYSSQKDGIKTINL